MACKVSELNSSYPTDCPTLHRVREQYAGWNAILDKKLGYLRYYRQVDGRQVMLYEHHLVAQAAYGDIPQGHHVHHVNEQRTDNRAANLLVLSATQHAELHIESMAVGRFRKFGIVCCREYVTVSCAHCGRQLRRLASKTKSRNYCSTDCQRAGIRKVARPTTDELRTMLDTSSYEAIGRQFGVTGKAVKKWAVQYGLT
jgi:hypothetical protein